MKEREAHGDYSHSGPGHVCDQCRCRNVAGKGTNHYGVGFCHVHEKGRRKTQARAFARNQALAIRQGWPMPYQYESENEYLARIAEQSQEARQILDTQAEINLLRATLQEFEKQLYAGKDKEREIVRELKALREAIQDKNFVDPQQADRIIELLEANYFKETELTDTTGKGLVPMSDRVKMELKMKLARSISKLAHDYFAVARDDMVTTEQVRVWLEQIIVMTRRFMSPDDFSRWLSEFKLIDRPRSPAEKRVLQRVLDVD